MSGKTSKSSGKPTDMSEEGRPSAGDHQFVTVDGEASARMDFNNLIRIKEPPANRARTADGPYEHHFDEGAIMLAYAMHLLRTTHTPEVRIHPDGIHGIQFGFAGTLQRYGFTLSARSGKTTYGGTYVDEQGRKVIVHPRSGLGDVVAVVDNVILSAECKGGIINTRHPGQVSRLNKGLCETVGRLMASPAQGRQAAVVPYTQPTLRLAQKLVPRCTQIGIEIILVKDSGEVFTVRKSRPSKL